MNYCNTKIPILLKHGLDCNYVDENGANLLFISCPSPKVVAEILKYPIDLYATFRGSDIIEYIKVYTQSLELGCKYYYGACIESMDLILAARRTHL
jgi:hypothetical protein